MAVLPFVSSWPIAVTPQLRQAAEYRVGHKLRDRDVVAVIHSEIDALIARWTELGAWITHLEHWHPAVRPALSGIAVNNPDADERARRSASMKAVWAAKRAKGERLPTRASTRAPTRVFGQRAVWRTPEQKAYQSARQREAWARRKALAKEA